jgi:hypothetical protein
MAAADDALISDPEVQQSYQARQPDAAPTSSTQQIHSWMNRGMVFATTDGTATDRAVLFLREAQRGIGDANFEANESGRIYLEGDRKSEAEVRSVARPVIAVQGPRVGPYGERSPIVLAPDTPGNPLLGGN